MVTWAVVQQITPTVTVRLAGDDNDVPVALKATSYTTPATSDKVAVARLGGAWVILCSLEDATA